MAFGEAAIDAFARNDLSVIVAKVAAVGPNHYGMDLQLPENAFRFKRWIREKISDRSLSLCHPASVLTQLVDELNRGRVKVVDLTQPLGPRRR